MLSMLPLNHSNVNTEMGQIIVATVSTATVDTLTDDVGGAREGRPSGVRPYGYRFATAEEKQAMVTAGTIDADEAKRSRLLVNESEAEIIREIADRVINGYGLWSIAEDLNARGVSTPRGGERWHPTSIRSVIRKPAVAGLRARSHPETAAVETVQARWEAILDEQRWQQAVRGLGVPTVIGSDGKRRAAPRTQHSHARRWLLTSGLARCSECRRPLAVIGGTGGRYSYTCHRNISDKSCCMVSMSPAEEIERYVVDYVFAALENPKMAKLLNSQHDPEREKLLAQLKHAEELMDEAAELRGAGVYDERRWEKQFLPAKASADEARAALAALPDPDIELPPLDQLRARWEETPLRQRRAFLDRHVDYVEIKPAPRRGRIAVQQLQQRLIERVIIKFRR
jgi:hypothetical protein